MTSHAKIALGLLPLLILSFPLAIHEGWGHGPSTVLVVALVAMTGLAVWRGRGPLHHDDDDPVM